MSIKIPWWGKITAKLILSRLPIKYSFWQRLGLFRHGQMDSSEYALQVFVSHMEKANLINSLDGKTILELGPGDSISTAIIATTYGAKAVLVDAGYYLSNDVSSYFELQKNLTARGFSLPPGISECKTVEEILTCCDASYLTEGLNSFKKIESESIDFIFSQAVLEHISRDEFLPTMLECKRILVQNGVSSHQIDLRDHLGGALNNLRFNEKVWESNFFTRSGFYTNRIQFKQMLNLFNDAGFNAESNVVKKWKSLPTARKKLSRKFRNIQEEDLCVAVFDVLLRL